ncbi:MAG TPA: hypothetical protein VGM60_20925 [Pseudonocardia sp.]
MARLRLRRIVHRYAENEADRWMEWAHYQLRLDDVALSARVKEFSYCWVACIQSATENYIVVLGSGVEPGEVCLVSLESGDAYGLNFAEALPVHGVGPTALSAVFSCADPPDINDDWLRVLDSGSETPS